MQLGLADNTGNTVERRLKSLLVLSVLLSLLSGCAINPSGTARHGVFYFEPDEPQPVSQGDNGQSADVSTCGANYRVRSGDTLSGIAVKCQVTMLELARVNNLSAPYFIKEGQVLLLSGLMVKTPQFASSPSSAAAEISQNMDTANDLNWVWPMSETVPYQYQKDSSGRVSLSFYPQIGQPVYAVENAKVAYAGEDLPNYGKMVVLKHDNGYVTVYAYNHRLEVQKDQQVKAGDLIARAGQSGDAKKPELHFEVRYQGRKVNVKGLFKAPPTTD